MVHAWLKKNRESLKHSNETINSYNQIKKLKNILKEYIKITENSLNKLNFII